MNRSIFLLAILTVVHLGITAQEIPLPTEYSVVDTVSGDLDKDGIKELVVAYNTDKTSEDSEGVIRDLIIYKKEKDKWISWKQSLQALLGSRDGGMMGDPYEMMEIKNGILMISHAGGSSWKWGHTDKYRFQNDEFYLIGFSNNYGKPCEYWEDVDFNLSTGWLVIKKEYEDCDKGQEIYKTENESFLKKGLIITLQNRHDKKVKLVSPKYKHEIYL
ncbi:hypothetical protein [Pollutibacter soli]|uniref:hypothetical protein n=1 Tax=Pollutibacter soli TaxID=3034157 RepID=UPI00301326D1